MRRQWIFMALLLATPAVAGDAPSMQDGSYKVEVRLLLPHLEELDTRSLATLCLRAAPAGGTHGLVVLSANNPLARCPASNVRTTGEGLQFDIVCPGHNQAVGWATYRLAGDRFQGRIEMKMGGKNMTMTETQVGSRVGACAPGAAPHS